LAEELSFRRAAERLSMSPSSLSRHIQEFESEIGFRIFDRDRHSVSLTSRGQIFLAEVGDIPEVLQRALENSRAAHPDSPNPIVRVGYGRTRGLELIEHALTELVPDMHPYEVELIQMSEQDAHHALAAGEVDLTFVRQVITDRSIHHVHLFEEEIVAILPAGDVLLTQSSIPIEHLFSRPFVSVRSPRRAGAENPYSDRLRTLGQHPLQIVREVDSVTSMFLSIEAGVGVGLAPEGLFRRANFAGIESRPVLPSMPGVSLYLAGLAQETRSFVLEFREVLLASRALLGSGYQLPTP
jgi:DNA-binding transcriptional LysR family regulator